MNIYVIDKSTTLHYVKVAIGRLANKYIRKKLSDRLIPRRLSENNIK